MGRGDRHKVRWAHDRKGRKKAREKRKNEEAAKQKKGS
jgi:hypothetical protein